MVACAATMPSTGTRRLQCDTTTVSGRRDGCLGEREDVAADRETVGGQSGHRATCTAAGGRNGRGCAAQTTSTSISPTPATRPCSRSPRATGPTPDGVPVKTRSPPARAKSPDR